MRDLQDRYFAASTQFKTADSQDERRRLLKAMGEIMAEVEMLTSELRTEFDALGQSLTKQ